MSNNIIIYYKSDTRADVIVIPQEMYIAREIQDGLLQPTEHSQELVNSLLMSKDASGLPKIRRYRN